MSSHRFHPNSSRFFCGGGAQDLDHPVLTRTEKRALPYYIRMENVRRYGSKSLWKWQNHSKNITPFRENVLHTKNHIVFKKASESAQRKFLCERTNAVQLHATSYPKFARCWTLRVQKGTGRVSSNHRRWTLGSRIFVGPQSWIKQLTAHDSSKQTRNYLIFTKCNYVFWTVYPSTTLATSA